ncbi:MAG: cell envelope integrity protein TolA [Paludibacteraceae bacterium]|nr:cell envelope integrity protein TolA [Paludibacteraceae bacterium]
MKRVVSSVVSLLVLSISYSAFSQERNVIVNTNSVGRTVITTNPNSNGNVDIWAQLEQERLAAEKAEQERIEAAKKAEEERLAAEKADQERIAAEQAARLAAEKAEKERLKAEKAEQQRIADSISTAKRLEIKAIKKVHQDSLETAASYMRYFWSMLRNARKERVSAYPWSNFVMVNGAYALYPEYAFGITYARVRQWGFYVSAMMNPSVRFQADHYASASGAIDGEYPFYSGKHTSTRISATAGALVRLHIPMYLYAGIGYGYRGLFYETTDHKWVAWRTANTIYHGMHWEAGLMGNIKGFAISLGVSSITNGWSYYEAKLGLGYCF